MTRMRQWLGYLGVLALVGGTFPLRVQATHIMGGEVTYTFLGYNGNNAVYRIRACLYRDPSGIPCGSSFWFNIYRDEPPNYPLQTSITLPAQYEWIQPPSVDNCNYIPSKPMVQRCCYVGVVQLPISTTGYHIVGTSCCRPGDVDNLVNPGGQGFVFYNYIPPTFYNNSSPSFLWPATPWLCAGDTTFFNNGAVEVDGDVLVYRLVKAYSSTGFSSVPPFVPVQYLPNYDSIHPFGPLGVALINSANGLTMYYAPNPGQYVVAVEILEFRNGVKISETRRDYEVLVDNCPPNDPPEIVIDSQASASGITQGATFFVTEGDSICFPIMAYDDDGDGVSITFEPSLIFNSAQFQPPASISPTPGGQQPWPTPVVVGGDTVLVEFCWVPCTGTASPSPYNFAITVMDSGCPPKASSILFSIFVRPFQFPPDSIVGPEVACLLAPGQYTTVDTTYPYTYEWHVVGGTIVGSDSDRVVTIEWDTVPPHVAEIMVIKRLGPCRADTLYKFIYLDSAGTIPVVPQPERVVVCEGQTDTIWVAWDSILNYSWTPNVWILNDTDTNFIIIQPLEDTTYHVEVWVGLCRGEADIPVTVNPPIVLQTVGDQVICRGDSVRLGAWGAGTDGYYEWRPGAWLSDSTVPAPWASPPQTITYEVYGETPSGCWDTATLTVYVYDPPVIDAVPSYVEVTPGSQVPIQVYVLGGDPPVSYTWTPAEGLDDPTSASPTATATQTITYVVEARNEAGCVGYDSVRIVVLAPIAVPTAFTPNGDGVNDIFRVFGYGVKEFHLQIFNRWGELVFETYDIEEGWDGTHRGKPQPSGTYAYYVRAVMANGEVFEQKGSVTLIR